MGDESVWVDELDEDVCWRLLASPPVGRIAFVSDGELMVLPVNHAVDGRSVVFRTGETELLERLARGATVAFQVDDADTADETGWSVLVRGECSEISDAGELERVKGLGLRHWAPGRREHWLRVTPWSVTGRSIAREQPPRA